MYIQNKKLSVSICNIQRKQGKHSLFGRDIAIHVFHKFLGIIPDTGTPEGNGRSVQGNILALARLEAFIVTYLTYLRDECSDTIGDHRQKLYLDTFATFPAFAYNLLTSALRQFFNEWRPTEFIVDGLSIDSSVLSGDP